MNKRARNRLIGVTAIIVIAFGAIIFGGGLNGAYVKSVKDIATDESLVGQRVKFSGEVVPGSWEKGVKPLRFKVRQEPKEGETVDPNGPQITIVYNKAAPSTFGNNVVATVTGKLQEGDVVEATDLMTKCPSKYKSKTGADKVGELIAAAAGKKVEYAKVTGFVATGSMKSATEEIRFVVQESASGGAQLKVAYEGALPAGMTDGSEVVLSGSLGEDGVFTATDVALPESAKK